MLSFLIFFILSLFNLGINIIFYFKENGYSPIINKLLLFIIFSTSTIFLIINLPYFIINDSNLFLEVNNRVIIPTVLYNISLLLYIASIILFLLFIFQIEESVVFLETPSRVGSKKGKIYIGKVLRGRFKKQKFNLSLKDLEKHMFVCGATGTGKSNFLQNFLINFTKIHKIPFFLVEFKGEYHFLQNKIEDLLIFWPGENFSINIFHPGKSNPIIHAERIFDILKSGKLLDENTDFSPQMEAVLIEILTKTCKDANYRSWLGFEHYCEQYLKKNKTNIPMLNQTLISIKNRIRRFAKGPLKVLFEENNSVGIEELFKNRVLLDLSSIIRLGGEKEDALFFLNMILKYLWDKNLTDGTANFNGIKHLTIIEDAQYFAPQDLARKNKLTTYLEDIALLQRGTGECLITLATRPDISKEILANNGIVLTFKNHLEKDIMCDLLNLSAENRHYLSILEEGQCIIRINSIKEPFLLKVPFIKHESIPSTQILHNNNLILDRVYGKVNSIEEIKEKHTYKFIKLINILRMMFPIHFIKGKEKMKKINNEILNTENLTKTNLEDEGFECLKNYINELYNLQNKKDNNI